MMGSMNSSLAFYVGSSSSKAVDVISMVGRRVVT